MTSSVTSSDSPSSIHTCNVLHFVNMHFLVSLFTMFILNICMRDVIKQKELIRQVAGEVKNLYYNYFKMCKFVSKK